MLNINNSKIVTDEPECSMNIVFDLAKTKALIRNRKSGNTATPWLDFTTEHLSMRLGEEFEEWKDSNNSQELLDIINLAAFLWLSRFNDKLTEL